MTDDRITGKTRLAAVIGNPVEHSISPQLHNTLSRYMGTDLAYIPVKVEKEMLDTAVQGFCAMGFVGVNVTIPHKKEIVSFVDRVSDEAQLVGAVNTIKICRHGIEGYNTDGEGFVRSFREDTGSSFGNKTVVILGAGGAARSIAFSVVREGAANVIILNRTLSKAEQLCTAVSKVTGAALKPVAACSAERKDVIGTCDIVINTTPVGMYPDTENMPVDVDMAFSSSQTVYDIIYNPPRTRLLQKAENCGCMTANGLGMLVYQGIAAYEIWMDIIVPGQICTRLYDDLKKYMLNKGF